MLFRSNFSEMLNKTLRKSGTKLTLSPICDRFFIFETDIRSISLEAKFGIAFILNEICKTEPENQLGIEKQVEAIYWCLQLHCIILNVKVA